MAIALTIAFTPTPLPTGERIVIEATKQISQGINFVPRSSFRNVFIGSSGSASPSNILSAYTALFGALVSGQKIFFRVSSINATGARSAFVEKSAIVV